MKVLFYVTHLLGVGHVARTAALARGMADEGLDVRVMLGGEPVPHISFGKAQTVQLPPARSSDASFTSIVDENGKEIDDAFKNLRTARVMEAYNNFKPDVLAIELFPFGRRRFKFELLPLFEQAVKDACPIACSLRDVLVRPSDDANVGKARKLVDKWFDKVLVHGDPKFVTIEQTCPEAIGLDDKIAYTGYVVPRIKLDSSDQNNVGQNEVIVSVGGGATGEHLLKTALQACKNGCLKQHRWRFLTGPNLDQQVTKELVKNAPENAIVEPARSDFRALLSRCALSISQAGYNTLLDVVANNCRSLMLPFSGDGQTEQLFRAKIFREYGLIHLIENEDVTPEELARAVEHVATLDKPDAAASGIDLDGVKNSIKLLRELVGLRTQI